MIRHGRWRWSLGLAGWLVVAAAPALAQSDVVGEWRHYGADGANTKYSPLDQITVTNFSDLQIAWRWISVSTEVAEARDEITPGLFKATPLMVDGMLYVSTPLGQVAALDPGTGEPGTVDPRPVTAAIGSRRLDIRPATKLGGEDHQRILEQAAVL